MVSHFSLQSEALRKLSLSPKQVVATGGGAVVRPVNWYSGAMDNNFFHLLLLILYKLYIYIYIYIYIYQL
jgi:shikimate kinase